MRFIVIAYDKTSVCVNRLEPGQVPPASLKVEDVLCEGSSFDDVVKSLQTAFAEEQMSEKP